MAEFLIRAQTNQNGTQFKGDIVEVRRDNAPYGRKETLPEFCIIKIPGLNAPSGGGSSGDPRGPGSGEIATPPIFTFEETLFYMNKWKINLNYAIVDSNLNLDQYIIEITNSNASTTKGRITRSQVETFINGWNGTVISAGDNLVRFDIGIYDAVQSKGFWGRSMESFSFNELSYTSGTGVHQISAGYNAFIPSGKIEKAISEKGGSIVSHSGNAVIFEIDRITVRNVFIADIKQVVDMINIGARQYYIDSTLVDAIISAGGITTVPGAATAVSGWPAVNIRNKVNE